MSQDEKSVVLNKPETEPDLIHHQSSKNFQKIQKEMNTRINNQIQKTETKRKNVTIRNKDISILNFLKNTIKLQSLKLSQSVPTQHSLN